MQNQTSDNLEGNPTEDQLANGTNHPHPHRHCLYCNYNLHHHTKSNTCPECGKPFDPHAPLYDKAYRKSVNHRIWYTILIPLLCIGIIGALAIFQMDFLLFIPLVSFVILPITSILASILFTQVELIGHPHPSAFKKHPAKAILHFLIFSMMFLLPQAVVVGFIFFMFMLSTY